MGHLALLFFSICHFLLIEVFERVQKNMRREAEHDAGRTWTHFSHMSTKVQRAIACAYMLIWPFKHVWLHVVIVTRNHGEGWVWCFLWCRLWSRGSPASPGLHKGRWWSPCQCWGLEEIVSVPSFDSLMEEPTQTKQDITCTLLAQSLVQNISMQHAAALKALVHFRFKTHNFCNGYACDLHYSSIFDSRRL